jgi:DNA-binding CsgD family transcriptional regulator
VCTEPVKSALGAEEFVMVPSFQSCDSVTRRFQDLSRFEDEYALRGVCDVLWWGLTHGALSVVHSDSDGQHAVLRIRPQLPAAPWSLRANAVDAFERVLLGCAQKVVAIDLSMPLPSLSSTLRQLTQNMGFRCCVSRIPVAVPLLLHALRRRAFHDLRVSRSPGLEHEIRVSVRHRYGVVARHLSSGERDVALRLLEGQSYLEIARQREVSVRTVANQLSSVFRKVGASGRFDLLRAAVERGAN